MATIPGKYRTFSSPQKVLLDSTDDRIPRLRRSLGSGVGLGLQTGREGAPGSDLTEELSPLPGPNQTDGD